MKKDTRKWSLHSPDYKKCNQGVIKKYAVLFPITLKISDSPKMRNPLKIKSLQRKKEVHLHFLEWWSVGGSRCLAPVGLALQASRRPHSGRLRPSAARTFTGRSRLRRCPAGSIPLLFVKITIETVKRPSLLLWWSVGGSNSLAH